MMKAILLDGSHANDRTGEHVGAALTAQLQAQGWDTEHIVLREKKIGNCAGDFFCWIRSPGVCNVDDDNRVIAAAIVASELGWLQQAKHYGTIRLLRRKPYLAKAR